MKEEQLLKNLIKGSKKVSFSLSLLVAFLISGGISFANNTGIALNDDAVSIGKGALSTGKSTIAIGTDSFSSGNSLTREEYNRLLAENEAKLREIQSEIDKNGANKEELKRLRMEHSDVARKIDNLNGLKNNLVDKQNEFTNIESTLKREIEVKRTEAVDYSDKIKLIKLRLELVKNIDLEKYSGKTFDEKLDLAVPQLKEEVEKDFDFLPPDGIPISQYKDIVKNVISNEKEKVLYDEIKHNKYITKLHHLDINWQFPKELSTYLNFYSLKNFRNQKIEFNNKRDYVYQLTKVFSYVYNPNNSHYNGMGYSNMFAINSLSGLKVMVGEENEIYKKLIEGNEEIINKGKEFFIKYNKLNNTDNDLYEKQKLENDFQNYLLNSSKNNLYLSNLITKYPTDEEKINFLKNFKICDNSYENLPKIYDIDSIFPLLKDDDFEETSKIGFASVFNKQYMLLDDINNYVSAFTEYDKRIEELQKVKENVHLYFQPFKDEIDRLEKLQQQASEYITERETRIAGYRAEIQNLQNLIANSNEEDIEGIRSRIEEKENEIRIEEEKIASLKNSLHIVTTGENAMATGKKAVATGKNSMSTGFSTFTSGENAIAIGTNSTVIGNNSIALGTGHKINGIGSSTIGDPNNIFGNNNHVYGNNNNIGTENNLVNNNFILGSNVISTVNNAIVLGNESTAVENAISVGSENNLRKIVNVGEGEINNTSNEVIVGKQVFGILNGDDAYLNNLNINKWKNKLGVPTTTSGTTGNNISNVNLGDYVRTDGSGIDKTSWTSNLSAGANIEHPTNTLVTDTIVKNALDNKINKDGSNADVNKFTEKLSKDANMDKPNDKLVTDTKVDKHLKGNYYNKKEVNSKLDEKADKTNTYTKKEVDIKIQDVVVKGANLDGEVVEGETKGVTGDKVAKSINQTNRVVITNTQNIDYVYRQTQVNRQDIKNLSVRMDKLDSKINKVASLSQASANLHFGNVRVGNMAVGAGVATYMGNQAVAVGVAYRPNEDWFLSAKWSGVTGDPHYNSLGGSVSYQFNFK